jgi:hypothetical protein
MTASLRQEVETNPLRSASPGSAQTRADAENAGCQDLGDLVEPFGCGHEIGMERVRQCLALCLTFETGGSERTGVARVQGEQPDGWGIPTWEAIERGRQESCGKAICGSPSTTFL